MNAISKMHGNDVYMILHHLYNIETTEDRECYD